MLVNLAPPPTPIARLRLTSGVAPETQDVVTISGVSPEGQAVLNSTRRTAQNNLLKGAGLAAPGIAAAGLGVAIRVLSNSSSPLVEGAVLLLAGGGISAAISGTLRMATGIAQKIKASGQWNEETTTRTFPSSSGASQTKEIYLVKEGDRCELQSDVEFHTGHRVISQFDNLFGVPSSLTLVDPKGKTTLLPDRYLRIGKEGVDFLNLETRFMSPYGISSDWKQQLPKV